MSTEMASRSVPVPHQEDMSRLRQLIMGFRITQMIHVAAKLGLADHLARKPQTARELAPDGVALPSHRAVADAHRSSSFSNAVYKFVRDFLYYHCATSRSASLS